MGRHDADGASGIRRLTEQIHRARRAIRLKRRSFAALIAGLAVLLCAAVWPSARAHLQAVAVLRLVGGQPVPWMIRKIVMEPVRTEEVRFSTAAGVVRGRLYLPERHRDAPALMVLHGVHHLGIDEPRMVGFASAMAGCGLRVLTPELPGIKAYHVDESSVRVIGESAKWFAEQTGAPVGVLGLSFSGGLALVAAAQPAYRNDFKFVLAVGSQDRMEHVANFYLTGEEKRPDGSTELLKPHEYGSLVLEYDHLEDFVPTQDATAIRPVLREHLYEDKQAKSLTETKLTPSQRAEAAELMDSDSPATKAKLAASDAKHAQEMAELSPHGILQTMTTPVYLLHGEADNIIPAAETLWISSELPRATLQEELISPVLSHLDFDEAKPGAWDQWRLVHFFAVLIHAAERK